MRLSIFILIASLFFYCPASGQSSLPDPTFYTPSGWHAPIILSHETNCNGVSDTLFPFQQMYSSLALINAGDTVIPSNACGLHWHALSSYYGNIGNDLFPGVTRILCDENSGIYYFGFDDFGGPKARITVRAHLDPYNNLIESNETNNDCWVQYVIHPTLIGEGRASSPYNAPPGRGDLPIPNCHGFRFLCNKWTAIAIRGWSTEYCDYELRLHDDYRGSTQGFEHVLKSADASSTLEPIYILVNRSTSSDTREMYAGITRKYTEEGNYPKYFIELAREGGIDSVLSMYNEFGPYSFYQHMIQVHAIYIPSPGTYRFELINAGTTYDFAIGLYGGGSQYLTKEEHLTNAFADDHSEVSSESFVTTISTPGIHAFLVYLVNKYYADHVSYRIGVESVNIATLISTFNVKQENQGIKISWSIVSDGDVMGFNIYRILEGERAEKIVNDQGLIPPDSREYIDQQVRAGLTYKYTLGVVLDNNTEIRSPMQSIETAPSPLILHQNHPNPFNPTTKIHFQLPNRSHIVLEIFDVSGKHVRVLLDKTVEGGIHSVDWDGRNNDGKRMASGIYFYRLKAGKKTITKKMVLLQ